VVILGHFLFIPNDVITSWLRLAATLHCILYPHST
jgi:hypothetical protein